MGNEQSTEIKKGMGYRIIQIQADSPGEKA